jgi:site-specific recombinase XerD
MKQDKSPDTLRAYASDWRDFLAWCVADGASPLPADPATVIRYFGVCVVAEKTQMTIRRRACAIAYHHHRFGVMSPTLHYDVREFLAVMRRNLRKPRQARVISEGAVLRMLALCPDTLIGKRDRALLALGFTDAIRRGGAFRRAELVALNVGDLAQFRVPYACRLRPLETAQAWLTAAEISNGPVFRAVNMGGRISTEPLVDGSAARIVKRYARRAGIDSIGLQLSAAA